MPARKTKGKAATDTRLGLRAETLAAAGAADVTRSEGEAAAAATYSALSDDAARRGARDAAEGAATLSMADQVAVSGELSAALSSDEFRRGMELAGIAGQVQVAAELLRGVDQPTLAAFLGRTSHQLRGLSVDALSRATESAIVAHDAEHLAGELATLGRTETGAGRDAYADAEALGAASAEMAAAAVRSAAAGAAELAAATARDGMAHGLADARATHTGVARRPEPGRRGKDPAATPRPPKPTTRAASKRSPTKPPKP